MMKTIILGLILLTLLTLIACQAAETPPAATVTEGAESAADADVTHVRAVQVER